MWICVFMFSLLFLVFKRTTSLFLSPMLRFNKADWFHLQPLSVWGCCTVKTELLHGLHTGFTYWYICRNICISEKYDLTVYPFGSLFLEIKWLFHDSPIFYSFELCLQLEVTWSINSFHLCYRGKKLQQRKPQLYYLVFKERQLRCELFLLCVNYF